MERLKACFAERPLCTRLYLSNKLQVNFTDEKALFKALQYVAYLIPFGPWRYIMSVYRLLIYLLTINRGCWVIYGVDPRTDFKYRIYQTLDMRSVNTRSSKVLMKITKTKEAKKLLKAESDKEE